MLKNENIICISSIDWDFIWQGHQEIMSAFAKNGNRVLFIENTGARAAGVRDLTRIKDRIKNWSKGTKGIREKMDNLFVYSPITLPFPYSKTALWINRHLIMSVLSKWVKAMNFTSPIIWVFLPTPLGLSVIDNLENKNVIYYCIDNFRVSSKSAKKIEKSEIKLLKKSDLVFVTSKELYNYCSSFNDKVYIFPFSVNFRQFEKVRLRKSPAPVLKEIKDIKRPIIGYVGGVHKWIDFNLVKETAQRYPQYSFVFVGPLQADVSLLKGLENIYFLDQRPHSEIPDIINNFDVCTIPYLLTDYTKNVYPTKLNEYHALGKPVVSTNLPEIEKFNSENDNLVIIGKTHEEFIDSINKALDDSDSVVVNKRIESAKRNSWDKRIMEMSGLIEDSIEKKPKIPFDWRDKFLKSYKLVKRKTLKIAFLSLIIYFIIFYTPLVWFIAGPLKISQPPQKADCIVVFAGGVGESGQAGQGYEERVGYAVQLYKKEYADNIIFSSGYRFVFEEPLLMKALAVSLGVPEGNIILEDNASNTYENVKFSSEILNNNNWDDILLVSSPYHMRRCLLVFNKADNKINVRYTPIPTSAFYSHGSRGIFKKKINLRQIKGIVHEYLGILYYWWKGYV